MGIDDQYLKLLESIFSKQWLSQFEAEQCTVFLEIRHYFQTAKSSFYNDADRKWHNVRLPCEFLNFLEEKIEDMGSENLVRFEGEYLEISTVVWRRMFDHVITPTILHVQSLLEDSKLQKQCNYLCLVGGLSRSPYFEWRMRRQFGSKSRYKMEIVVPRRPMLSVVEGAA